jgi:predicted nucleic acid-binding protein
MGGRPRRAAHVAFPRLVIVVDTSAWIEYFRASGRPVHRTLRALLQGGADLAVTEVVVMELLAGKLSRYEVLALRARLLSFPVLRLRGLAGYDRAAELFRVCRTAGETIRNLTDCLVAVPTIEAGGTLLHDDHDFEVLARHTPLRLEPLAS